MQHGSKVDLFIEKGKLFDLGWIILLSENRRKIRQRTAEIL